MHKRATKLIRITLLALGTTALSTNIACAATIVVDTLIDDNSVNGNCSLREAIMSANSDTAIDACVSGGTGVDTIQLAAGTYTLSIAGRNEDSAVTGDLDLTGTNTIGDSYVIKGAVTSGAPLTIIDASHIDRIFDIFNPAEKDNLNQGTASFSGVTVTLQDLKLINGLAEEAIVDADTQGNGGAVYSFRFNNLTISNCVFENNRAVWDGKLGVLAGPDIIPGTDDDIDERTLSGHGGAVYSRGSLSITNSSFSNNIAYTTIDQNSDGTIEGEAEKNGNGGAVFTAYPGHIANSTFSHNVASNGGGMNTTGGDSSGAMMITGSTFVGNTAVMGGGINNISPQVTLDITNSTISANTTSDMGAGVNTDGPIKLKHVTVVDNHVTNSDQHGAGINYFGPQGAFLLANTLLSNNLGMKITVNCGCTGGTILACSILDVTSWGGNISNDFNCGLNPLLGDFIGPDPKVLPLASNGGVTQTHALDYDSIAIDAGKDINCIGATPAIVTDQRGTLRSPLVDGNLDGIGGCDIGAFERHVVTTDLILNSITTSANVITVNDEVTIRVAASNTGPDAVTFGRVDIVLPAELELVSAAIIGGADCSRVGNTIGCNVGTMTATTSKNIVLTASAAGAGTFDLSAKITALESDLDAGNNNASTSLIILPLSTTPVVIMTTSGGGFCSYNPGGRLDLTLPLMLMLSLGYLWLKRSRGR